MSVCGHCVYVRLSLFLKKRYFTVPKDVAVQYRKKQQLCQHGTPKRTPSSWTERTEPQTENDPNMEQDGIDLMVSFRIYRDLMVSDCISHMVSDGTEWYLMLFNYVIIL